MQTILTVLHLFLAIGLIGLVLMQHGKGADAGAAFGSGASGTVFGASGAGNFLSRSTAILATLFFITSIALGYFSMQKDTGSTDIMKGLKQESTSQSASKPTDLPQVQLEPVAPGDELKIQSITTQAPATPANIPPADIPQIQPEPAKAAEIPSEIPEVKPETEAVPASPTTSDSSSPVAETAAETPAPVAKPSAPAAETAPETTESAVSEPATSESAPAAIEEAPKAEDNAPPADQGAAPAQGQAEPEHEATTSTPDAAAEATKDQ